MIDPIVTELRLMLRARGFLPIPLEGKRPPMEGWQTKAANADEIRGLWPKVWHLASTASPAATLPARIFPMSGARTSSAFSTTR
jgi:hypothetical protein